MDGSEIVEDLTDTVEVVFHPNPNDEEFDPLSIGDEEMMELEEEAKRSLELARQAELAAEAAAAAEEPQPGPSTSRAARSRTKHPVPSTSTPFIDHIFQIPNQPPAKVQEKPNAKSPPKPIDPDSRGIRLDRYKFISPDKPKYMPAAKSEGFSILEYEAKLAAEKAAAEEEKARLKQEADDAQYEETLIYVDLDDIPSIQELFAVEPDDFLAWKKTRDRAQKSKPVHPELQLKFYNLDDKNPILQIGRRFYTGVFEEPMGSSLFFREKSNEVESPATRYAKCGIRKLTSDLNPPPDPVFGNYLKADKEYEMVANVHKVLKMTRRNAIPKPDEETDEEGESVGDTTKSTCIPSFPSGVSPEVAMAYEFKPKRELRMDEDTPIAARYRRSKRKQRDPLAISSDSNESSESGVDEIFEDDVDDEEEEDELEDQDQVNGGASTSAVVKMEQ